MASHWKLPSPGPLQALGSSNASTCCYQGLSSRPETLAKAVPAPCACFCLENTLTRCLTGPLLCSGRKADVGSSNHGEWGRGFLLAKVRVSHPAGQQRPCFFSAARPRGPHGLDS